MNSKHPREGLGIVGPSEEREKVPGEDFLTYDDRQMIRDSIARGLGEHWESLSASDKNSWVDRVTRKAVDEVMDMEGSTWDDS